MEEKDIRKSVLTIKHVKEDDGSTTIEIQSLFEKPDRIGGLDQKGSEEFVSEILDKWRYDLKSSALSKSKTNGLPPNSGS